MEFSLAEDAREAIDNMDQSELFGRVIKCSQAKPQKDSNEGLGARTAVWEQVRLKSIKMTGVMSNANVTCRRAMRQSTMSTMRSKMVREEMGNLKTRCRDWKAWMLLGLDCSNVLM